MQEVFFKNGYIKFKHNRIDEFNSDTFSKHKLFIAIITTMVITK